MMESRDIYLLATEMGPLARAVQHVLVWWHWEEGPELRAAMAALEDAWESICVSCHCNPPGSMGPRCTGHCRGTAGPPERGERREN